MDERDKYGVSDNERKYHKISLQFFGKAEENSGKNFLGPFVDLTGGEMNRKSAVNNPEKVAPSITSGLSERCLICYSEIIKGLEMEESWGNFLKFLRILHEPIAKLNGNRSRFNWTVRKFKERGTRRCLCGNCAGAFRRLVEVHREMKMLEREVKELKAKFLNAIKLSKVFAEMESGQLIVTGVDELRRVLIGGNEKWEEVENNEILETFSSEETPAVKIESEINSEDDDSVNKPSCGSESEPSKVTKKRYKKGKFELDPNREYSMSYGAVRYRELRAKYPHLTAEQMKEHLRTLRKGKKLKSEINCEANDDDDNANPSCSSDSVAKNKITEKKIYKKRKFKIDPNREYSTKPGAVRYRELRAKYPHLTAEQMKAHLRTLPGKWSKGKPRPILNVEDLKQSKTSGWYRRWRESYGKTMSIRAYHEMRRKELLEEQRIKDGEKGDIPGRSKIGAGGLKIKWEGKGDGKFIYCGVEIKENEDGTFSCGFCENKGLNMGERVKNKSSMNRHIKNRHMERTNGHACDKCDAKFFYHWELTAHVKGKHEGGFQCEICGQSCQSSGSLNSHKKAKHQDVKPHVCEYCGKGFATKKDMTIHVRTHTGERPFACRVCSNTYTDKYTVNKHMKKFHPEEASLTV